MKNQILMALAFAVAVSPYAWSSTEADEASDVAVLEAEASALEDLADVADATESEEASEQSGALHDPRGHYRGARRANCVGAKLEDGQRAQIREIVLQARKESIQLRADLKLARLQNGRVLRDAASDLAAAEASSAAVAEKLAKLLAARSSVKNKILFSVLDADQRKAALDCAAKAMRDRKASRHGSYRGRRFGQGRIHGGHGHGHGPVRRAPGRPEFRAPRPSAGFVIR
jgi:hypothetical protein